MTSFEFMRRYEAMPGLKGAQLIDGQVLMPVPVPAEAHAAPHGRILGWLGHYSMQHPELAVYRGVTLILDDANVVEPDAIFCTKPNPKGWIWIDGEGYLRGSPEMVCEIALSSGAIDLQAKFRLCRRHAVQEYLVWITDVNTLRWFHLVDGVYIERQPNAAGFLRSGVFPDLVLDADGLLGRDRVGLVAGLEAGRVDG